MEYLSLSPLLFTSLLFTAICKASSDSHFAYFTFLFCGDGLNPCLLYSVTNLHLQFIRHSVYQIQSLKSISHFHCIIIRDLIQVILEWSSGFPQVISFANIFSYLVSCLLVLSMDSFALQKHLSLMKSHLFIFAFISFALGDYSKKRYFYDLRQGLFCLWCFFTSFMTSDLTFRSLIHIEFTFIHGVRT